MSYINGGVRKVGGKNITTKAELKRLITVSPHEVEFYCTDYFNIATFNGKINEYISTYDILSVVGPDPYTNRKWYASIYCNLNVTGRHTYKVV